MAGWLKTKKTINVHISLKKKSISEIAYTLLNTVGLPPAEISIYSS